MRQHACPRSCVHMSMHTSEPSVSHHARWTPRVGGEREGQEERQNEMNAPKQVRVYFHSVRVKVQGVTETRALCWEGVLL